MEGLGTHGVLGIEAPDPALSLLGALGLAISAGTALVVDLTGDLRTTRNLADFVEAGPALAELSPGRRGVALLAGAGVDGGLAERLISDLCRAWPAVVVRCRAGQYSGPTLRYRATLPGLLAIEETEPTVWQLTRVGSRPAGPGPTLPVVSGRLVRALLSGRVTGRGRWIKSWERVWEMPWA